MHITVVIDVLLVLRLAKVEHIGHLQSPHKNIILINASDIYLQDVVNFLDQR